MSVDNTLQFSVLVIVCVRACVSAHIQAYHMRVQGRRVALAKWGGKSLRFISSFHFRKWREAMNLKKRTWEKEWRRFWIGGRSSGEELQVTETFYRKPNTDISISCLLCSCVGVTSPLSLGSTYNQHCYLLLLHLMSNTVISHSLSPSFRSSELN